ncbi:MAG: hypothetical protein EXR98_03100 [Gemmataceae bacterium]|nr:hypothetical protein [Gemmataceae bacterium]
MKRWLFLLAILAAGVGLIAHNTGRGQFPGPKPGPGEGGATLKLPGLDPVPGGSQTALPNYVPRAGYTPSSAYPSLQPGGTKVALMPSNVVDFNRDIEITPEAGPWAVFVMAYNGPRSPEMARKLVTELRTSYKYPAYVFNYGAEEKRKEYERVQKARQVQIDALQKAGLKADVPIRVPAVRIDEQTGVLVGGFRTREDAAAFVEKLRKQKPPDPKNLVITTSDGREIVALDTKFAAQVKEGPGGAKVIQGERVYQNPFLKALPVHNPTSAREQTPNALENDLKLMRKLNVEEPFSLFQCKKPLTLAIAQYGTQHKGFLDAREATGAVTHFGVDSIDPSAQNARNLAKALRKDWGLTEAYVLHTRYSSYVTVGGFDSEKDPRLVSLQNELENRFLAPAYGPLKLFPRPVPMQVPR